MSDTQTPQTFQDQVEPVQESIEAAIDSHRAEINRLQSLYETVTEIEEQATHYDSVACATLSANEVQQHISLCISAYNLDEDIREVVTGYEWTSVVTYWMNDAELWKVELQRDYEL